jgi:ABC-type oligopeptide transport system substrate-binding subunit
VAIRGEPYDLFLQGWIGDYADGGNFLATLLDGRSIGPTDNFHNQGYFDDPETNARIDAANRLSGEARSEAWADLDVDLMRDNPPWAPIFHSNQRAFVSKSFGCFVLHALNGVSIAAACKK